MGSLADDHKIESVCAIMCSLAALSLHCMHVHSPPPSMKEDVISCVTDRIPVDGVSLSAGRAVIWQSYAESACTLLICGASWLRVGDSLPFRGRHRKRCLLAAGNAPRSRLNSVLACLSAHLLHHTMD